MHKFTHITILLLGVLLCSCSKEIKEEEPTLTRPNILFIMTDDHSYQTLSAYDDRFIQTPHLDRIAKEGVIFPNSFVTNSICAPSRAVMLTGKHNHLNGQINNSHRFDSSQITLPKVLQNAGYQTAIVGKWHLRSQPTGFDHWEVLIGQGNYYNSDFIENGNRKRSEGYVTDVITDKGIAWLDQRDKNQPFSLFVHHKATHRIWMPDTALLHEFEGVNFEIPDNFFDTYANRLAAAAHVMGIDRDMDLVYDLKMLDLEGDLQTKYRKFYVNMHGRMNEAQRTVWDNYYQPIIDDFKAKGRTGKELALWKYQRYMQDYLKCVKSVDNNVGRLLDYLDAHDLAENTLVIYTSDQGFYMGEHGWFDKRFMYEESLRTPLLMRYPKGMKKKGSVNQMVQNIDYAPTMLDFAGIDIPKEMQGKSMKGFLSEEEEDWRDAIYYHYYEFPNEHGTKKHYGIRTDRYKLIHFYDDIDVWELFDLEKDPTEMNNLIDSPDQQTRIEDLKVRLTALQKEYQVDQF